MFEDSTFESLGIIRTRSRQWMLATFALNGTVVLALVLLPLFHPEALSRMTGISVVEAPPPPIEPTHAQPMPAHAVVVQPQFDASTFTAPSRIPTAIVSPDRPEVFSNIDPANLAGNGAGSGSPDGILNGTGRVTVIQNQPPKPAPVTSGVMEGLLVYKAVPIYPRIALAARTQGTVVLEATISKSGSIENLRVMSGPIMLQQAALDAVRQWRYRPYLLNGQPVEVETTVNVVFKLD
jgi:periplasmic protein TonB